MEVRGNQLGVSAPRAASVLDYHERGRQTRRTPPLPLQGPAVEHDGLQATFSLQLDDRDRVTAARFQSTSCTTLVAYCQLAADLAHGRSTRELARLDPRSLIEYLRGVPAMRRDRAAIATAALRAAAGAAHGQPADSEGGK